MFVIKFNGIIYVSYMKQNGGNRQLNNVYRNVNMKCGSCRIASKRFV